MAEDEKYRSMREYSRVDAYLPMELSRVSESDRERVRSRTSVECLLPEIQALPELDDHILSESLKIINSKLDTIIKLLTAQNSRIDALTYKNVNLSAGGLSMDLGERFRPGELVEVRIMFPSETYLIFYVYGEVLNCEEREPGTYHISVEFTEIDEDIRDRIAKYVFERQREVLRKKRRQ
ncbi:MAG: PilZ domain-containing protein [Acidobacteriota bacterium]